MTNITSPTFPGVSTEIGKHYAADLREGLESLLLSWNVEAKEAA